MRDNVHLMPGPTSITAKESLPSCLSVASSSLCADLQFWCESKSSANRPPYHCILGPCGFMSHKGVKTLDNTLILQASNSASYVKAFTCARCKNISIIQEHRHNTYQCLSLNLISKVIILSHLPLEMKCSPLFDKHQLWRGHFWVPECPQVDPSISILIRLAHQADKGWLQWCMTLGWVGWLFARWAYDGNQSSARPPLPSLTYRLSREKG